MSPALLCCLLAAGISAAGAASGPAANSGASSPDWLIRASTYRSKYYNITTDFTPEDAKRMAEHVDSTFESYLRLFSKLPVRVQRPAALDLYLFVTEDDYHKVLKARFGDEGLGSWGTCISSGNRIWLVGWRGEYTLEQMKPLLQHEGFHQLARHLFGDLPVWANEGLAELFERGIMIDGQLVLGEVTPATRQRLLEAIAQQKTLPLDQFFKVDHQQWLRSVHTSDAGALYLQAWSLVHFLIFADQGKYEAGFLKFLVQLNRGMDWRQAFVASFGMPDFKALETKWLDYARTTPPADYRETVRRLKFLSAGLAELHKQGRRPTSLDELREQLQEINFECQPDLFGQARKLSAADRRMFEVPFAEGVEARKFTLVESRSGPSAKPPPYNIAVGGLEPQAFAAQWTRRGRETSYAITVSPAGQQKTKPGSAAAKTAAGSSAKPSVSSARERGR